MIGSDFNFLKLSCMWWLNFTGQGFFVFGVVFFFNIIEEVERERKFCKDRGFIYFGLNCWSGKGHTWLFLQNQLNFLSLSVL